jgi:hypothetical protein
MNGVNDNDTALTAALRSNGEVVRRQINLNSYRQPLFRPRQRGVRWRLIGKNILP